MNKRIGGAALALAAVAFFAAACGSSDDNAPAAAGASGGTDYVSCLRNNGVNLPQFNASDRPTARPSGFASGQPRPSGQPRASGQPRPSGSAGFRGNGGGGGFFGGTAAPSGVDQQTWEKAQKACASLRPSGGAGFNGNGGGGGGGNGRDAAYRNCLTEHGLTITGSTDQLDTTDAKVAAAVQACAPLKPAPAAS
jgi:hypothetical protein